MVLGCLLQTLIPAFAALSAPVTSESYDSILFFTYNVYNGLDDNSISLIMNIDADILAIQEAYHIYYQENLLSIHQLSTLLSYDYYASPENYNQGTYGLAIFSKYEIIESSFIELTSPGKTTPRGLLFAKIRKNTTVATVVTTHFDLPFFYFVRNSQAGTLLENLESNMPTIVLGDFNTPNTILDFTYWRLFTHLHDTWVVSGNPPFTGKTWPVEHPYLRVDYIFVNDFCTTVKGSAEIIANEQSSDHLGLAVRLHF